MIITNAWDKSDLFQTYERNPRERWAYHFLLNFNMVISCTQYSTLSSSRLSGIQDLNWGCDCKLNGFFKVLEPSSICFPTRMIGSHRLGTCSNSSTCMQKFRSPSWASHEFNFFVRSEEAQKSCKKSVLVLIQYATLEFWRQDPERRMLSEQHLCEFYGSCQEKTIVQFVMHVPFDTDFFPRFAPFLRLLQNTTNNSFIWFSCGRVFFVSSYHLSHISQVWHIAHESTSKLSIYVLTSGRCVDFGWYSSLVEADDDSRYS